MWVVIDANVVVSGLIGGDPGSPPAIILDGLLAGRFAAVLSEPLLSEYREVLLRPALRRLHGLSESEVDAVLTQIVVHAAMRSPCGSDRVAPDRGDQHLWDLLDAEPGAVLVTGDRLLLENPPAGVTVWAPARFVSEV